MSDDSISVSMPFLTGSLLQQVTCPGIFSQIGFYALSNGQSVATETINENLIALADVSMPFLTGSLLQQEKTKQWE